VGYRMTLLLDTCTFLWLVSDPPKLSAAVAAAIDADDAALYLSDASIWEVCLKWQAGKIVLPDPPRRWFMEQTQRWYVAPLPLEREHYFRTTELPSHHKDPFDRLLVAQAIERGMAIVTPDAAIAAYPVRVIW
jgi:PIN domain nuclease of toxin-antitoxin system